MAHQRKSSEQIGRASALDGCRTVILDIETVAPNSTVDEGGPDSLIGRVACITSNMQMMVAARMAATTATEVEETHASDRQARN